jgi:hypothetical protein
MPLTECLLNASKYLVAGSLTPDAYQQIMEDAWTENWSIQHIKEAYDFIRSYPVVSYDPQCRAMVEKSKARTMYAFERVLLRHSQLLLQDFFTQEQLYD